MASVDIPELPGTIGLANDQIQPSSDVAHVEEIIGNGASSACNSKAEAAIEKNSSSKEKTSSKVPQLEGAKWQWEHRTGFRDYTAEQSARIEFHYQRGDSKVRLKSGKSGNPRPMEVFFVDMKQYDPVSGNDRRVRRQGKSNCFLKLRRYILEIYHAWYSGQPYRQTLEHYQKKERLVRGQTQPRALEEQTLYHTTGICQKLAKNNIFVGATMFVVMVNALWIAIDLDNNDADIWTQADVGFQIAENLFCSIFTLELAIRFGAFRVKRSFYKDRWFVFDSILVLVMVVESWAIPFVLCVVLESCEHAGSNINVLSMLRLGRIMRLTRMTRLIRLIPELMILLKGIFRSFISVFYTLLLLVLMLYVFGIFFRAAAEDFTFGTNHFPTVTHSMWSLAMYGVLLDSVSGISNEIETESKLLMAFFAVFILLSTFCVLNMLIGIVCEVITSVKMEEEAISTSFFLENNLSDILECYDRTGDRKIDRYEFELFMLNPEAVAAIEKFGTDVDGLTSLADVIFEKDTVDGDTGAGSAAGSLSFDELLGVIKRLRGENHAKVTDVNELRQCFTQGITSMEDKLIDKLVDRMDERIMSHSAASLSSSASSWVVEVRLSVMAETEIQRCSHSSNFTIGELVQQFMPRYGQLVVTDTVGVELGCELTLGELSATSSESSAPLRQLDLKLIPVQ